MTIRLSLMGRKIIYKRKLRSYFQKKMEQRLNNQKTRPKKAKQNKGYSVPTLLCHPYQTLTCIIYLNTTVFHFHLSLSFCHSNSVAILLSLPKSPRFYPCSPSQPRFQFFIKKHHLPMLTSNTGQGFKTSLGHLLDPTLVYLNLDQFVYLGLFCD